MEAALRSVVQPDRLLEERWKTKCGEIESLINVAARDGLLSEPLRDAAHLVRQAGNDAVHGKDISMEGSWKIIQFTRRIVEQVYERAA